MPWIRRHTIVLVAVVVVGALGLGGVRLTQWRHEQAYLATLVGRPDILAPVDASLAEVWRTDAGIGMNATWQVIGDQLVGAGPTAAGLRVVAIDTATGAVRWAAVPGIDDGADGSSAECHATRGDSILVCLDGQTWTSTDDGGFAPNGSRTAVVLDLTTGAVLSQHPLAAQVSVAGLGDGVVVAEVEPDGHLHVGWRDPITWAEAWSYDAPVEPPLEAERGGLRDPSITVADGHVAVGASGGALTVLTESGAVTRVFAAADGGVFADDFEGRLVLIRFDAQEDGLVDLATGRSQPIGQPLGRSPGDGSLGESMLTLLDEQHVGIVDVGAGTVTSLPVALAPNPMEVLAVRGTVLVSAEPSDGGLTSYDHSTGAVRWRVHRPVTGSEGPWWPLMTDGRVALSVQGPAYKLTLVAYDVRDGHRRWEADAPAGITSFQVLDSHLYGFTSGSSVVRMG